MIAWLSDNAWWVMVASAAMFVCGMGVMVAFAVTMPADHFMRPHARSARAGRHPLLWVSARVIKNLVGAVLIVLGLAMAVPLVPGPGIVFILIGVSLTDMPGKRAVGRYIVRRPLVLQSINALRTKWHRPPLQLPHGHRQ